MSDHEKIGLLLALTVFLSVAISFAFCALLCNRDSDDW